MNVAIYARYSSHSQTEQSIEGQLQTCYEYAKNNGHVVIGEYIDRAQSGTTDSRAEFQRMIADSDKHTFEGVLVYQLDRFARNRYDSAINKAKLKKNGVRVISARENIADDASGILVEGVLESMAEYYSAELSQKIRRGMSINAEKCLSNGSNPGLGYYVDEERRFHVDPETAPTVREIFELYASGKTVAEITKYLNAKQVKTSLGKEFNKNSLHRLLRNKRYIGYYIYKGTETPDGMPRIIEDELFERVQHILDRNKKAPARSRGREEYLLTTKLFCGYCREMMTGYGGTGKSGKAYHYYACNNFKRRKCRKKVVSKEKIEDRVVLECRNLLTDSNIEKIALAVAAVCEADYDSSAVKRIKAAIQEADTAIENLWKALERGQAADMITGRIEKRQKEREELRGQLAIEMGKQVTFTAPQIRSFLYSLKRGNINDENNRRGIINIFLRAIYLYDDRMTLILNGGDRQITIDDILLDEIEEQLEGAISSHAECSSMVADAPPTKPLYCKGFII
jgi:site-specific DNA recombinase